MFAKLSAAFGLSLLAQASASLPVMPELVGFGASASAFGVLVWLLTQVRADLASERANFAAQRDQFVAERAKERAEFLGEIREHRAVVASLQQALTTLRSEMRRD
jgi:hypothetical protein